MSLSSRTRGRRWRSASAVAAAAALTLTTASVAMADSVDLDGDTVKTTGNVQYGATDNAANNACSTRGTAVDGWIEISYDNSGSGTKHYTAGEDLTVAVTKARSDITVTTAPAAAKIPTTWSTGASYEIDLDTTVANTVPVGTHQVTITVTGQASGVVRDDIYNVIVDAACPITSTVVDTDGDTVPDSSDNCPSVANTSQANADGDALGDACDSNSFAPAVETDAGNTSGNEGSPQTNLGSFTDADNNSSVSITGSGAGVVTDNGDGTWSWTHTPADNGGGTVTVTADDGEHAVATDTFDWAATNVAPSVSNVVVGGGAATACLAGNDVTLDFGFSDPGVNDADWAVDIDWGDGGTHDTYDTAAQGAQPQASHSYAAGTYTIGISVTDKDGGQGSGGSVDGAVSLAYNMTGILAPFNADGSSVWKYGSTIPVKVKVTDCDGTSVPGLTLRVGTQMGSSAAPSEGISETQSTSAADSTGVMRYDATAGQYIYNFATKYLADGNARYTMFVRSAAVVGQDNTGADAAGQSYQKFGLKTK